MKILSLEESALIKICVSLWCNKETTDNMRKLSNGLVDMEDALAKVKRRIADFSLSAYLTTRLVNVAEKMGYELYTFLTRSPVNVLERYPLPENIKWTRFGLIDEYLSFKNVIYQKVDLNQKESFKCACWTFDEKLIEQAWGKLSENAKRLLVEKENNVIIGYWTCFLMEDSDSFISRHSRSIIKYDGFRSINFNLALHCIHINSREGLRYFLNRTPPSENRLLFGEQQPSHIPIRLQIFINLLKAPNQEFFRFICSFLEAPIPYPEAYELTVKLMPSKEMMDFIQHILRLVSIFGDVHYHILVKVTKVSSFEVKSMILSKLDVYVLTLIGKGRYEMFEYLSDDAKPKLLQLISHRLTHRVGLSLFFTIFRNNQTHLLHKCFEYLSSDEKEKHFLMSHLQLMLEGTHYDLEEQEIAEKSQSRSN